MDDPVEMIGVIGLGRGAKGGGKDPLFSYSIDHTHSFDSACMPAKLIILTLSQCCDGIAHIFSSYEI